MPDQRVAVVAGTVPIVGIRHNSGAPAPVKFAARELQRYLEFILGNRLPIHEGEPEPGCFFIAEAGSDPSASSVLGTTDDGRHDHAAVSVAGGCVLLAGENPISALFAVYDFLKARCGVRFFGVGPEHEYVVKRDRLALPAEGDVLRQASDFALRDYWTSSLETADFAVKNRLNMVSMGSAPKGDRLKFLRDRGVIIRGPGHIWSSFVPDAALFKDHPEFFPMNKDGQREMSKRTACFSNREVNSIFLEKLRGYLRANREWDIFAFWAEDVPDPVYCHCPECAKITLRDWYMILVNQAAQLVAEELPRARFEFIAYHGTRNPPAAVKQIYQGGQNMILNLCIGYSRDIYHPLASATHGSAAVYEMYRNWRKYLDEVGFKGQILLMEYYNLCEGPNQGPRGRALLWPMEVIREDTRFYRADKIDGLGNWVCFERLSWPSPFCLWAWLQLYTDCDRTIEELKDDFYPKYFGDAGSIVRRYADLLESAMHERVTPRNIKAVESLAKILDEPNAPMPADIARRINAVRIHNQYCVMLKRIYQAFIDDNVGQWQELEKPFREFFEVTHRQALTGEMDIPPHWANSWYDYWAKSEKSRKQLVENPARR